MKKTVGIIVGLCLVLNLCASAKRSETSEKPNVLLIMVDDMNDWVGAYGGHPQAITPNMDRFAKKAVVFKNAYCSAALCNPSRASMLTGYRPSTTGVYGNEENFRHKKGFENTVTLPQYFNQYGYSTIAGGKIFHSPHGPGKVARPHSDPGSFEQERWGGLGTKFPDKEDRFQHGINYKQKGISAHKKKAFDWDPVDQPVEETNDWLSADYCAKELMKKHDKPFFLACGIFRPHLPWYAPKKYFDMYHSEDIVLPKTLDNDLDDVGPVAKRFTASAFHKELVRSNNWKEAVKAYLACLTFADDCVGHLLQTLENSKYNENTIVLIMGDHGWHLGEKHHWSKNTVWEEAAKTPLMIYNPYSEKKGECTRIVSLLDIYPTLVDLCGLPEKQDVEGKSIKALLENPNKKWDEYALTSKSEGIHTLRNENYRYIWYSDGFEELYDHRVDPMEWENLAKNPEKKDVIMRFRKKLDETLCN